MEDLFRWSLSAGAFHVIAFLHQEALLHILPYRNLFAAFCALGRPNLVLTTHAKVSSNETPRVRGIRQSESVDLIVYLKGLQFEAYLNTALTRIEACPSQTHLMKRSE